jgi:amino acid permease
MNRSETKGQEWLPVEIPEKAPETSGKSSVTLERRFRRKCGFLLLAIVPVFLICAGTFFYCLYRSKEDIGWYSLSDFLGLIVSFIPMLVTTFGCLPPIFGLIKKYKVFHALATIGIALLSLGGILLWFFLVTGFSFNLGARIPSMIIESIIILGWLILVIGLSASLKEDADKLQKALYATS